MAYVLAVIVSLLAIATTTSSSVVHAAPPTSSPPTPPPLLIWHGLGDNYNASGIASVGALAQKTHPGTLVYAIRIDEDPSADRSATFLGNLTTQLAAVCADLAAHPALAHAPHVNALGFSQGGQFLRAFVQRCGVPRVRSLVTFGAQHNGISEFQACGAGDWVCRGAQALLSGGRVWSDFVQSRLVPAQYFRDPEDLDGYLEGSNFLADVNNERPVRNATYKENLKMLRDFVMVVFEEDQTVVPKESGWFAEVNRTSGQVTRLQDRRMYKEDWLGLRELDQRGALKFETTPGKHMQIDEDVLEDMFKKYFGPDEGEDAGLQGPEQGPLSIVDGDNKEWEDMQWDDL